MLPYEPMPPEWAQLFHEVDALPEMPPAEFTEALLWELEHMDELNGGGCDARIT